MFTGKKFEAVENSIVASSLGFSPHVLDTYSEAVTAFINAADTWAEGFGYEFNSITARNVIFKRIDGRL